MGASGVSAEKLDHTELTFGKYRGRTPDWVSERDPSYIVWMYEKFKHPVCSELLYKACQLDLSEARAEAAVDERMGRYGNDDF